MTTANLSEVKNNKRPITKDERRILIASSLGTVFEWYDFFLYGSLAAVIAKQFFAKADTELKTKNPIKIFLMSLLKY